MIKMWQNVKIVLCIFVILTECFDEVSSARKEIHRLVRVDRLEVCNSTPNAAITITDIRFINPPGKNVVVNIRGKFLRELRQEPKAEIYVTRCLNKESLDTCIPFTVLKPMTSCGIIAMANTAWAGMITSFHPPFKCPFHVGTYEMINGTVDADMFKFFPIDNFYWKVKCNLIEDVDFVTVCFDVRVIKVYV